MAATIRDAAIKNTTIRVHYTINGSKYMHYSYCKHKHNVSVVINGATYYKIDEA